MNQTFNLSNVDLNLKEELGETPAKEMIEKRDAAKALFVEASNGWKDQREHSLDDLRFYQGDQWNDSLRNMGKIKKEPTITVNRLPNFVKQVENDLRQRDITIDVCATDEAGSEDTAEVLGGIIRHIENDSHAKSHYIHAAGENGALVCGFGFLKADLEYVNNKSFDQKIMISSVDDPFKIIPDPAAMQPDFSDANYWFEVTDYTQAEYKAKYPRAKISNADLSVPGAEMSRWISEKGVRTVRYWYKEELDYIQYLLEDGTTVDTMKFRAPDEDYEDNGADNNGMLPFPTDESGEKKIISRERRIMKTEIHWMDFNGVEILAEGKWIGEYFPFVAVTGPQNIVDGLRDIRGVIRYAKDSQRMLNYMASSAARRIGSANKSPWIIDAQSIKPYAHMWKSANVENWAFLPYDAYRTEKDASGNPLQNPPPQRADQTGQIADLMQAAAKFEGDLKACIGIYDAGLGATPNDQSGVAIKTLAQQGQNSNYHYSDALVRAIERLGCILIDLIPKVYNTPRAVRIINPDSTEKIIKINQMFQQGTSQKAYMLSEGEYGVKVNAGPAFATRKQEATEQMLEVVKINPNLMPLVQDELVANMDFDGAKVIQDRLQKLFASQFPQLVNQGDQEPLPPHAQAQIATLGTMVQKLTQELQLVTAEYEKAQMEIATKHAETVGKIAVSNNDAKNAMRLEEERAKRDKLEADLKMRNDEIAMRLDHVEAMYKILAPHMIKAHTGVQE